MLCISIIQWWYTRGWKIVISKLNNRLKNAADFFSIRLLVGNLFAPFRQISAGDTPAASAWFTVLLDKLLSRVVGAVVRLLLLVVGIITIILQAIWGVLTIVFWPLVPLTPAVCIVLTIMQVTF